MVRRTPIRAGMCLLVLAAVSALVPSSALSQSTPQIARSASCAPLPPGAISWWPGDGSPSDCLGGLSTIVHGGVTYQSGAVGGCLAFDGTSAWVELPFTPGINFAPTAAFTIEAWVRADGVGGAETGYRAILVKCPPNGFWDWGLYLTPDNRFMAGCQAGYAVTSSTVASPGQWYHVAVTYDAGAWTLYVDGVAEATSIGPLISQSDGAAALARKGVGDLFNDFLEGAIDEAGLYSRALSSAEVEAIHKAGAAGKCVMATPTRMSTWGSLKHAYR